MHPIQVVARIKIRPDVVDKVQPELFKLVDQTREKDKGCIKYDLYQDNQDHSVFFFIEDWESESLLNQHLNSPHIKAYREATRGMIIQRELNLLTQVK